MRKRVVEFLQKCQIFYVTTMDGDQPRVRPFGVAFELDGKIYFTTGRGKAVYNQMQINPKIEISTTSSDGTSWIRLRGKAVYDGNMEAKKMAFEVYPGFDKLYQSPDNPNFEVFYLADATGEFCSFGIAPEKFKL
jgi:Uncharacterized conserved protein